MHNRNKRPFQLSSSFTRPANVTPYAQNQLIASSTSAGSIVVPSFTFDVPGDYEFLEITGGILLFPQPTGMTTFAGIIDLWSAAPTFTNGDGGAYAVATGAAGWIGRLASETADARKAFADGTPLDVSPGATYTAQYSGMPLIVGRNSAIYWSLRESDATGFTPTSAEVITLTLQGFRY